MANEFVRNTTDLNSTKEIPLTITEENDLVSNDKKQHFIRRKDDYHCLTDNVKSMKLNGKELKPDLIKNQVTLPNLTQKVDKYSVNEHGNVSTDYPLTVNGVGINNKTDRNISLPTVPTVIITACFLKIVNYNKIKGYLGVNAMGYDDYDYDYKSNLEIHILLLNKRDFFNSTTHFPTFLEIGATPLLSENSPYLEIDITDTKTLQKLQESSSDNDFMGFIRLRKKDYVDAIVASSYFELPHIKNEEPS